MPPAKKQRSGVSPFQTSIRWKPDTSRDASKPAKPRGDRRRLVIGTEFDGYGVECLRSEAEAIVDQHCDYEVLTRFTKRSDPHTEPTVTDIVSRMEDEFDEANVMIEKFIGDLKKKKSALSSSIDDMLKTIGKRNKWWEETDIFAHDVPEELVHKIFLHCPLRDYAAYANYITKFTDSMELMDSEEPEFGPLIDRLLKEISRVAEVHKRTAMLLLINLQTVVIWAGPYPDLYITKTQEVLVSKIHEAVSKLLEVAGKEKEPEFMDIANLCDIIRQNMEAEPCKTGTEEPEDEHEIVENACSYNIFLETLDLLQRHAYFEIRANVRFALGRRLPAELVQLVFEHTMEIVGIGYDPRIILDATVGTASPCQTCMLYCKHEIATKNVDFKPEYELEYVGPESRQYAFAGAYVCLAKFPHGVADYKELCEKEDSASSKIFNDDLWELCQEPGYDGMLPDDHPNRYDEGSPHYGLQDYEDYGDYFSDSEESEVYGPE
ncbi:hypothetical protein N0V83_006058 [Neocucurbitaria cava]|uniref:Uncharacterized protein n=1 Tax=Neocucurbitaria cava TaxID=798079 RepID=A0A9W8Y835_9PLEO|nr:hypothetical protein N0V83_006058 [Neocucurbitaria cava]